MKIRKKQILSKSGKGYRVELNDEKAQIKVVCLEVNRLNIRFKKKHLREIMEPLNLKVVLEEGATIIYECPKHLQRDVLNVIRSS